MAKNPFWLRGARGKFAGAVAQKGSNGGTILRENVIPANPQTVDQMATRLAFGTVTQAAAIMLPIIGQTFKGQTDEKMNRRRFVALNVPLLKAEALSQRNGEETKGLFRGKSSNALIPNAYRISEGTLDLPNSLIPAINDGEILLSSLSSFTFTVGTSYNPAEVLAEMFGMQVNQQLTIVAIATNSGPEVNYLAADSGSFIRNTTFEGRRLVLNANAASFTFTENITQEEIIAALIKGINNEKSSTSFANFIEDSLNLNENTVAFASDIFSEGIVGSNQKIVAASVILSVLKDTGWDYSNSTLVFLPPTGNVNVDNDDYYGLDFNDALVDYLGSEAASKLYTRKGGLINDI